MSTGRYLDYRSLAPTAMMDVPSDWKRPWFVLASTVTVLGGL
jgi:hypothetical protein